MSIEEPEEALCIPRSSTVQLAQGVHPVSRNVWQVAYTKRIITYRPNAVPPAPARSRVRSAQRRSRILV